MAAIAERAGGALQVVGRVERSPPIGAFARKVGAPDLMDDVPLRRERKVIVTNFLEVPLLPFAAVDECDVVLGEGDERVFLGEIRQDGVGMFFGIANDVGHPRVLPTVVDLGVAALAGCGANVPLGGGLGAEDDREAEEKKKTAHFSLRIIGTGLALFERYTEHARRSIFFARYEASAFGTPYITCEELLLGILREDKTVAMRVGIGSLESIRNELEKSAPPKENRVSTSVDLPLSQESRRALRFAEEEANALGHKHIDAPHLLLGVLRIEDSLAAEFLRKRGIEYEQFRQTVARGERAEPQPQRAEVRFEAAVVAPQATLLEPTIAALRQLVDNAATRLRESADSFGNQRLKRKPWTRKEALGHLIDWAIAHRQWVTEALMESKLKAAGYPDEASVAAQHYGDFPWAETVELWVSLNRLLIHVLLRVPEDKVNVPCRIGIAEPVPLARMMDAYVQHCQDIVGQILARLD